MVILTEKPSVARDIAAGLGGFSYIKTKGWWKHGNDCIVHAAGHLLELYLPEDYDIKYKSWDTSLLPILPTKFLYRPKRDQKDMAVEKNAKRLLSTIRNALEEFGEDSFILATDADREGELIGYLILSHVGFHGWETAKRFWVSEALTPKVVQEGIDSARPLSEYVHNRISGLARAQADWLIGMNITRLLTQGAGTLLHFGRVQTCVLSAIVQRDRNIESFVPVPYWQLHAKVSLGGEEFIATLQNGNSSDFQRKDDPSLQRASSLSSGTISVEKVDTDTRKEQPPQLFSLTGLQKHCSSSMGLSPDQTLAAAQSLYEKHKCLSYPRTASTVMGNENVELLKNIFDKLSIVYPKQAQDADPGNLRIDNARIFDSKKVEGHHALIPLAPIPDSASDTEVAVYMAVLTRFFQSLMGDYVYSVTTVSASSPDGIKFTASGRTVLSAGWRKNANKETSDEEAPQSLPKMKPGDKLNVLSTDLIEKKTKPKKHFTNSTLLAMMEHPRQESNGERLAGLGTPATRASIISELIRHQYVRQDGQKLLATELGKFLIDTASAIPQLRPLMSLRTTTEWEQQLSDDPNTFKSSIENFIRTDLPSVCVPKKWLQTSVGHCPLCGKDVIDRKIYWSCVDNRKDSTGCPFILWKTISGASLTDEDIKKLISGGMIPKTMKSKSGKSFKAKLHLSNGKLEFIFDNNGGKK